MKDLLTVGDSLIAGRYGASLFEQTEAVQRTNLINRGQNGEPIKGILRNLQVHLNNRTPPEILLLDGGANDLLIPYMNENHPKEWALFFRKLARHGSVPVLDRQEFQDIVRQSVQLALDTGVKKIVFLTIPCLGENLGSPLNKKRMLLNEQIRSTLQEFQEENVYIADLAEAFENALKPLQPCSDWLFRSPMDLESPWTEEDSVNRGLHYTIDGVHLNRKGAQLAGKKLDSTLRLMLSDTEQGEPSR